PVGSSAIARHRTRAAYRRYAQGTAKVVHPRYRARVETLLAQRNQRLRRTDQIGEQQRKRSGPCPCAHAGSPWPRDVASIKRVFEHCRSEQGTGVDGTNDDAQAQRRKKVMDAAVLLAAEGGLEALRIRDVVARTSVSSATIYRYFASKEHLN